MHDRPAVLSTTPQAPTVQQQQLQITINLYRSCTGSCLINSASNYVGLCCLEGKYNNHCYKNTTTMLPQPFDVSPHLVRL
jgi:hypothetical protein